MRRYIMLKKFNSFEEFKYFFENFEYGEFRIECDYSVIGMRKAKDVFYDIIRTKSVHNEYEINEEEALSKAYDRYNSYIDFRLKNPAEFLCICKNSGGNMSTLMDIKQYLYSRTNKSKLDGEWISLFEIEAYLENDWIVYLVKDKNKRIEKEIKFISEIN